jgi:hypothetical protein
VPFIQVLVYALYRTQLDAKKSTVLATGYIDGENNKSVFAYEQLVEIRHVVYCYTQVLRSRCIYRVSPSLETYVNVYMLIFVRSFVRVCLTLPNGAC